LLRKRNPSRILLRMGNYTTIDHGKRLAEFLASEWAAKGITRGTWCRENKIPDSTVMRWARGVEPDMRNLRIVAAALDRPLVDVLLAAGYLSPSDVNGRQVSPPTPWQSVDRAIEEDPTLSDALRQLLRDSLAGGRLIEARKAKAVKISSAKAPARRARKLT
jgi:hypothetical protein